jgi:hypothetical protein
MSQIGKQRTYGAPGEATSAALQICPNCKVQSVPRGIISTKPNATGEKHCLNCGHVIGRVKGS